MIKNTFIYFTLLSAFVSPVFGMMRPYRAMHHRNMPRSLPLKIYFSSKRNNGAEFSQQTRHFFKAYYTIDDFRKNTQHLNNNECKELETYLTKEEDGLQQRLTILDKAMKAMVTVGTLNVGVSIVDVGMEMANMHQHCIQTIPYYLAVNCVALCGLCYYIYNHITKTDQLNDLELKREIIQHRIMKNLLASHDLSQQSKQSDATT